MKTMNFKEPILHKYFMYKLNKYSMFIKIAENEIEKSCFLRWFGINDPNIGLRRAYILLQ